MECIQLSLFGKTYPEHSVPTAAKISEPCWKNLLALRSQTFQFLDLRVGGADGTKPEQSPETDGLWHGDSSMLNIGEFPNAERESRLSWILEVNVPQWFWLVQRMHPYLKEKPALGSLFDGLGGFPLVWQRAYGEGTARWASEIEEFPMAVTKRRFGEE